MPFPIVWGIPEDTPVSPTLVVMRWKIVDYLVRSMGVPSHYVVPFFPKDFLGRPGYHEEAAGGKTIYVSLATGMFHRTGLFSGKKKAKEINEILLGLAKIVSESFDGKYEVEAFLDNLDPKLKAFIPAKPS